MGQGVKVDNPETVLSGNCNSQNVTSQPVLMVETLGLK